jgi:hypothetical protein
VKCAKVARASPRVAVRLATSVFGTFENADYVERCLRLKAKRKTYARAVESRLRWPHQQGGINDGRRSFSQLRDHAEPQGNEIRRRGSVHRLLAHGGVHHDELGGRIYQDHLAPDSEQGKTPLLAGQDPYLVSIAEIWGGGSQRPTELF